MPNKNWLLVLFLLPAVLSGQSLEVVREASMLAGDITAVTKAALAGDLASIALRVFNPLQFMLASPEPTAEAMLARMTPPIWLEEKYDGIRCQVHKRGNRAEIYSRDLHRITNQFPDLARAFVTTLPRIENFLVRHKPPFIAKVYRPTPGETAKDRNAPGRVELWYPR